MKKTALIFLLLAGCATRNTCPSDPTPAKITHVLPPMPPTPHKLAQPIMSPKAAEQAASLAIHPTQRILKAGPVTPIPQWAFVRVPGNTNGTFQIDGSTNLTTWFPVAVVYSTTNITLISDTVTKRSKLFYRVKQVN